MNIQKRLQIEFEFLGEEQISANTALKIVNDVFKEAEAEQLILTDVVHCFGKEDLQYVYEDVDTQFKSFEHWYEEYILPI